MDAVRRISNWKAPLKKLSLGLGAVVLLVALGGFLVAPPFVKSYIQRRLQTALHREVHIASVRVNPFALSVTVLGLEVKDRDGASAFVALDSLYLRLGPLAALWARAPVVAALRLEGPRVRVVRNEDGTYNFSDVLEAIRSRPSSAQPLRYSFNNIRLSNGRVEFDDRPLRARHEVTDLRVGIPFLSNLPSKVEIDTEPAFSATVDGRPVEMHGRAKPFSERPEMVLDVIADGLDLPKYLSYLPADLGVRVPSGTLDARGTLTFKERKDGTRAFVLSGRFGVNRLEVDDRAGGPLARLPRADAYLIAADLLGRRVSLSRLDFRSPEVNLARSSGGRWNLQAVLPASPPKAKSSGEGAFGVTVGEIAVSGGTLRLDDDGVHPAVRLVMKPLDARITSFDSGLKSPVGVSVRFATDSGATFRNEGTITPDPPAAQGRVELVGLSLGPLEPYLRSVLPAALDKGTLDTSTRYDVRYGKEGLIGTLADLAGSLREVSARLPGGKAPAVELGAATLKEGAVDLGKRTAQFGELSLDGAHLAVERNADGSLDLARALASPPGAAPPWQVEVSRLSVLRSAVRLEDLGTTPPADLLLGIESLEGESLSTRPGASGTVTLRASLNHAGSLEAKGSLGLSPPSLDWTIAARGLPILPFSPLFADMLAIQLTGGTASAKGRVALRVPDAGPVEASFRGDADLNDLATVDKAQMENFLNWKSLHLGGVTAQASPPGATIKEVALSDFYSRLIVSPEGKLNLAQILSPKAKAPQETVPAKSWDQPDEEAEAAPPAEAPTVSATPAAPQLAAPPAFALAVESVTLADGNINYTDHFIKPNYNANMTEVAGRISGLSSDPATRADLEVRARLDHQAPVEVTGKFNPLAKPLFLDIKGKATDIELSPMSPYSGKFAGYLIEKGKLNVEVAYHVENGKLDATNHIFLDQFILGDKVESKDATKLPVKLAIALLKDRQGRIDLTLPVSGTLSDPRFKLGRVILRIIVNLIAKALTSPFALLGRMFGGGGETLSFVEFEPGRATLDAAALAKVDQLGRALADRPALRLDIAGRSDPGTDPEGLKRVLVERRVKAEKLKELVKGKEAAPSLDAVPVDPKEYPELLFKAYKHMKFPKPRTLVGTAKELPADQMEQLMLANTAVTEDDLRQLAQARAQAVKDALCKPGGVDAARVFLVADSKPSKTAAKARPNRVDLSLK